MSNIKQKKMELYRQMTTLRGELLLIKRSQQRLNEKLESLLGAHAGIALLLNEERKLLSELALASDIATKSAINEDVRKAA